MSKKNSRLEVIEAIDGILKGKSKKEKASDELSRLLQQYRGEPSVPVQLPRVLHTRLSLYISKVNAKQKKPIYGMGALVAMIVKEWLDARE